MKRLISVSIPRSGHHLLVALLWNYFKHGQFLYCEAYTYSECCGQVPCNAVLRRAKREFGTDVRLRLFMQKSHDIDHEIMVRPAERYVVQLRDPAQAVIGRLRWEMTSGSRNNFSPGEIPSNLFEFVCYYVRFYHKWCAPTVAGSQKPDTHIIHYEQLVGSREKTRSSLLQLLEWLNLPIDDESLNYSLEKSLHIDAHTSEARGRDARGYDVEYYDRFCGGYLRFLLDKVSAFCPGLPTPTVGLDTCGWTTESTDQWMSELFFLLDLSTDSAAVLDFKANERHLQRDSLRVSKGYPLVCRSLGLSYGERGQGAWTVGDNVVIPFRISASSQRLSGEVVISDSRDGVDWPGLVSLTAVVEGMFMSVRTDFSSRCGATVLEFVFLVPQSESTLNRNSALVLKIANRNLLLDSLSISSSSAQSELVLAG